MHGEILGDIAFDRAQELQELIATVAPMQMAEHFTGSDIQRCGQRGWRRAVGNRGFADRLTGDSKEAN